jgi:hypothetical protein
MQVFRPCSDCVHIVFRPTKELFVLKKFKFVLIRFRETGVEVVEVLEALEALEAWKRETCVGDGV